MSKNYSTLPRNFQCVLDLPVRDHYSALFREYDVSRWDANNVAATSTATLALAATPLSNTWVWNFNDGNPDWLEIANAQAADLRFVAGAFSCAAWIYIDDLTDARTLFCVGEADTDGWYMNISALGAIQFITAQAGASQISGSAVANIVVNTWYLVGATRLGASVRLYRNGVDVTSVAGVHVNPLATARDFHIGIRDDEVNDAWSGYIWRPRAWTRQLTAWQMLNLFESERALFGV